MDSKDAQINELKARVAALEEALAQKEEQKAETECCGHSREQIVSSMADILKYAWEPQQVAGKWSTPSKEALLATLNRAVLEHSGDYFDGDSEWDCSCMTPECCYGGCGTTEDFKEWAAQEKAKGIVHERPMHDFQEALQGAWGLDRTLARAESEVPKTPLEVLREDFNQVSVELVDAKLRYKAKEAVGAHSKALEEAYAQVTALQTEQDQLWKYYKAQMDKADEEEWEQQKHLPRVHAKVPTLPGSIECVITPERALKIAVQTRHQGLGLTLLKDTMHCATRLKIGTAERLFVFTRDEDLHKWTAE